MSQKVRRWTWLALVLCILNLTAAVAATEEFKTLSEGTIVALGCLGGALVVALVLGLTCFLVRRYRTRQFLQHKKDTEFLHNINKEFSDSLNSSELSPTAKMTLLHNGPIPLHNDPIPTRGTSVQKYNQWMSHQPQPSPVLYSKRIHAVQPSDRHLITQRMLTVPQTTRTVVTQRPKYIVRQNRTPSAPPPQNRTKYSTQDRYGYTNSHFLPARAYVPATRTHLTKQYISQPQWRQEIIQPPLVQEIYRPPAVQEIYRPPAVQEIYRPPVYGTVQENIRPSPVQYFETVTTQAPAHVQTTQHLPAESTFHVKLDTNTMTYSQEKLGGSTGNILESTSYRDRTYSNPDYVVTTESSTYQPTVLQGDYEIQQDGETGLGWRVVRGSTEADSYRVSGQWTGHETEVKTQSADFGENGIQDNDAVFIQHEPAPTAIEVANASQTVQTRTYEEVVIVDYVEDSKQQNVSPLSTSTPRFTERSPIDDVLTGESSGSSSDSESDSGHGGNRRQRNPSSDE